MAPLRDAVLGREWAGQVEDLVAALEAGGATGWTPPTRAGPDDLTRY